MDSVVLSFLGFKFCRFVLLCRRGDCRTCLSGLLVLVGGSTKLEGNSYTNLSKCSTGQYNHNSVAPQSAHALGIANCHLCGRGLTGSGRTDGGMGFHLKTKDLVRARLARLAPHRAGDERLSSLSQTLGQRRSSHGGPNSLEHRS